MGTRGSNYGSIAGGLVLIAVGVVFFAATQGVFDLNWGTIWPIFPMIAGAAILLQALSATDAGRRAAAVLSGTIPLLLGAFFLATTMGLIDWSAQRVLWPIYPLIVGVAFLAAYLASGLTKSRYLIPGAVLSLLALAFLGITTIGSYALIGKIWPIFLIIAGVIMLVAPRTRKASL